MVELSTLSDPIKWAYYNADHAGGKPAEYFGAVPDAFDAATFTDNRAAIQAAINWSAANGRTVFFGGGVYGFDGTLYLKSNASLQGIGSHNTKFQQLNSGWPDCFAPENETTTGALAVKLSGFSIDGGWNKKADATGIGPIWSYDSTTMTQRGLTLSSSLDFSANVAVNREGLGDTYNHIDDLLIENVAGTGLVTTGRGEMRFRGLDIRSCANWGAELGAFDCWFDSVTIAICGRGGWHFTAGNQRLSNVKLWFIGMNVAEEYGVGMEVANGTTAISGTNITTQETWGTAFKIQGRSNYIHGATEATGCLQNRWGYGPLVRTNPIYIVELHRAQDCYLDVSVSDRFSNEATAGVPRLVGLFTAGPTNNRVILNINESHDGTTPPYDPVSQIYQDSGTTNAKRFNIVETRCGRLLLGGVTAAELGDASHNVNMTAIKSAGTQRWNATSGQPVWAAGPLPGDPWIDAMGTAVVTPV